MSFLYDQNLPRSLVRRLEDVFPLAIHSSQVGLSRSSDGDVWSYGRNHHLVIVTKDGDFADLSALRGHPPKVIWLRVGNCSVERIENLLRELKAVIDDFVQSDSGLLIVGSR